MLSADAHAHALRFARPSAPAPADDDDCATAVTVALLAPSLSTCSSVMTAPVSESGDEELRAAKPGFSMLATTQVLLPSETRGAVCAPVDDLIDGCAARPARKQKRSLADEHSTLAMATTGPSDTDDSSAVGLPSECAIKTPEDVQQRIREMRLGKRRRQRQQQKDELKHLALQVEELNAHLTHLRDNRSEFSHQTLVAAKKLNMFAADAVSAKQIWKQLTGVEREQLRTSLMENTRLRAQYECQLQIADGLKRLYESRDSCTALQLSPDRWFLTKKPRNETLSEDELVFASLGNNFDAQYAQADAIMDSAGLSNYDGELEDEMLLRKNEHGAFYFDNLYSKVFPFTVDTIGQVLDQCLTIEKLQNFHNEFKVQFHVVQLVDDNVNNSRLTGNVYGFYRTQVFENTRDAYHTKAVNSFTIGNTETTLTVHVATRKYREAHRVVSVWEAHIEAEGAVSMRLRETGWNIIRPAHTLRPGQRGPVSIEQACVRITPEVHISTRLSETSFAAGTLANVLIEAYHKRMEQVHLVADDILAIQLETMSLGD